LLAGYFWLPSLAVFVPIAIYSGGSLLDAQMTYRKWVDEIIAKYLVNVMASWHERISERYRTLLRLHRQSPARVRWRRG